MVVFLRFFWVGLYDYRDYLVYCLWFVVINFGKIWVVYGVGRVVWLVLVIVIGNVGVWIFRKWYLVWFISCI